MGVVTNIVGLTAALAALQAGAHTYPGPIRVLKIGHSRVVLPMKSAMTHAKGLMAIERAALQATGGGQVESVAPSVWVGKPVWMCTISQGRNVWHVMVSQTTLRPVSKIIVPRR